MGRRKKEAPHTWRMDGRATFLDLLRGRQDSGDARWVSHGESLRKVWYAEGVVIVRMDILETGKDVGPETLRDSMLLEKLRSITSPPESRTKPVVAPECSGRAVYRSEFVCGDPSL